MNSLFPDMDREILEDRKALKREMRQRAREYLAKRDLDWLVNYLLEKGPTPEHVLMTEVMGDEFLMTEAMSDEFHFKEASRRGLEMLQDLYALWLVRKLWRRKLGVHPGSGEVSFEYGIRNVHSFEPKP